MKIDKRAVEKFLSVIMDDVTEVRIMKVPKVGTISGYYNDVSKLISDIQRHASQNIYTTLNPPNPALLARSANKLTQRPEKTTNDNEIAHRHWFLVDVDPVRPSGIAASEEEKEQALELCREIWKFLKAEGWPEPVVCDSGNGFYLLYRIDLPNNDESTGLIKKTLAYLDLRFSNESAVIDSSVYNAARIIRLIGTVNRKGDHTKERPHRLSRVLKIPEKIEIVPEEKLEKLASLLPEPEKSTTGVTRTRSQSTFDVQNWLNRYGLEIKREKDYAGGRCYVLKQCPFNPEHTDNSAFVIQFGNGAVAAGCHHNSCAWNWSDLRKLFEPDAIKNDKPPHNESKEKDNDKPKNHPVVTPLSEVEPEDIEWLWRPYLPAGKLVILDGDPGVGKTWVALALCAMLTAQGRNVVYATCEDGVADTIKPRVKGMDEACLGRFFILEGQRNGNDAIVPVTMADLEVFEEIFREYQPAMIVLDPIQGFIGPDVNLHAANEVRSRLAGLIKLAEEYKVTALIVRHLRKNSADNAIYRGLGSIDISAAARSILLCGVTKDGQRVVAHVKSSLHERGKSLGFTIEQGRFYWVGDLDITPEELLVHSKDEDEKNALDEAVELLQGLLMNGEVRAEEAIKHARKLKISERTLRRARKRLGISARPIHEGGKIRGWIWYVKDEKHHHKETQNQGDHQDDTPLIENLATLNDKPQIRMVEPSKQDGQNKTFGHLEKLEENQKLTEKNQGGHDIYLGIGNLEPEGIKRLPSSMVEANLLHDHHGPLSKDDKKDYIEEMIE